VTGASTATKARLAAQQTALKRLARLAGIETVGEAARQGAVQVVVEEATFILPLAGIVDFDAERARLLKAIEKAEKDANSIAARLGNEKFLAKAPPHVVSENRDKLAAHKAEAEKLRAALARLA
ncbi:MAG: valine--tRNA ligase, partial [Alphaproteobacteria bacterium]